MTPVDWHPDDDDLTLHAYGENDAEARAAIERHLATCTVCARSWREIDALQSLTQAADVPEPGAEFEDAMWSRIAPALVPAPSRRWTSRNVVMVSAWAASIGAVVIAGHLALRETPNGFAPAATGAISTPVSTAHAEERRQRVLLTALDDHLSQTEMLFVELMNAPEQADESFDAERATADDLLQSGRLYRATAAEAGDRRITDVLDQVQTVLTEVAHGSDVPGHTELGAIRARIDRDDLLFKVRAVTHDIRDRQDAPIATNEGAL